MLNYGANIHSYSTQQILKRIKQGAPVLLPTGFLAHSVEVLFTQDAIGKPVFVLGNRGGESRKPVELYHYDPLQLTPEIIAQILDMVDSSSADFRSFFYIELKDLLSLEPSESLQKIASHCSLEGQTAGNCTWTSLEAVIWAQFQFAAQKIGTDSTEMLEYGDVIYTHWRLFVSAIQMENYLQYLEDEHLSPDQDDFLAAFQDFWRVENDLKIDIRLRQRIFDLNKRCFALFPTRVENPAPSEWVKAQKIFWNQWENLKSWSRDYFGK
jgi:hypothetical protein